MELLSPASLCVMISNLGKKRDGLGARFTPSRLFQKRLGDDRREAVHSPRITGVMESNQTGFLSVQHFKILKPCVTFHIFQIIRFIFIFNLQIK